MPSKLSDVAGMLGANCVACRAASTRSTWLETGRGFGLASISLAEVGGVAGTLCSGCETSFLYECPTITDLPESACGARGSGPLTWTVMLRPEPPASTTPAPTDSAARANTATTTPGRPSRRPTRFLKTLIPPNPFH